MQHGFARPGDRFTERRCERIDAAALEPVPRDQRLAAHRLRAKRQPDSLQRLALEALAEHIGPVRDEAAVRRPQRRDGDAGVRQRVDPAAIGAEPRPARTAERQHHGIGVNADTPLRRIKYRIALFVPADPMMTQLECDTGVAEPPQPRAQQRRGLERLGKHAAARSDEGVLAEPLAPGAHGGRRKRFDRGAQMRHRRAVAQQKRTEIFAVGEIEAAAPGQQEFSADRRHAVIDGDAHAALRQHLGRHQAGRPGTDHRNVEIRH